MGEEEFKCGGFKVKGNRVEINRNLASRTFDELGPADVYGLENCMRCGICSYTCPFWLVTKRPIDVPAWRTYEINKIYSMFYTGYGIVARYLRLRRISNKEFMRWTDSAYNCTACGACTETSPMEIPNWYTAILMRRILHYSGFNYETAEKLAKNTKELGNALGISNWKEMASKVGFQVDKKGSEYLYIPSPLEIQDMEILQSIASIFSKMKISVTVSSAVSDPGYYAYLVGDFETARSVFVKVLEEAKRLEVKKIITTDGTSYFWLRWQGPKSSGVKLPIPVEHLTQTVYEKYKQGSIKLSKADVKGPTSVHYSEFLSRLGGVEEPVREILRLTAPQFIEPRDSPSSHKLYTCTHHLELISEKKEIVKRAREYVINQLSRWGSKNVIVFDHNCKLSLGNAIADKQANFDVTYFTIILERGIKI
ncbi:(Fe-S)-binding protein [Sulfolobus sp. B1]|uniref:(Fe-S)-binding protein n=1 Tax=Sulfolobus sp. B1 TaxID=2200888 RepID=UPI0011809C4C|nr:(Fe-S)-binding protein [Sulfolobus sp. B1]TRM96969.1 (Fe-S)-binding protein [Sulfolobus sp. B1]